MDQPAQSSAEAHPETNVPRQHRQGTTGVIGYEHVHGLAASEMANRMGSHEHQYRQQQGTRLPENQGGDEDEHIPH